MPLTAQNPTTAVVNIGGVDTTITFGFVTVKLSVVPTITNGKLGGSLSMGLQRYAVAKNAAGEEIIILDPTQLQPAWLTIGDVFGEAAVDPANFGAFMASFLANVEAYNAIKKLA